MMHRMVCNMQGNSPLGWTSMQPVVPVVAGAGAGAGAGAVQRPQVAAHQLAAVIQDCSMGSMGSITACTAFYKGQQ